MSEEQIKDGIYDAVIRGISVIENRFKAEDGFEIEIEVGIFDAEKKPLTVENIYQELSARPGVGNNANKTSYDITMEQLVKLGFEGKDDLTRLGELVGKNCRVSHKTNDSKGIPYKNGPRWFLSFQRDTVKVDPKTAMAKLKTMMAAVSSAGAFNMASPTPPPPPPPSADPFANL